MPQSAFFENRLFRAGHAG